MLINFGRLKFRTLKISDAYKFRTVSFSRTFLVRNYSRPKFSASNVGEYHYEICVKCDNRKHKFYVWEVLLIPDLYRNFYFLQLQKKDVKYNSNKRKKLRTVLGQNTSAYWHNELEEHQRLPTHLNKFILKLNPVFTLFSGIASNQNTGCSGSKILPANKIPTDF